MTFPDTINAGARRLPTWPVYLLGVMPAVAVFYLAFTGGLGIDPVRNLEHELGEFALRLFIATLLITPFRKYFGLSFLKFRRPLGLLCFFYVVLHLGVWIALDMSFLWGQMWADIVKRPYITIGMVSFLLLIPLAVTSNNQAIRMMGAQGWQRLHRLSYPAALLAAMHYVMVQKVWEAEPSIYLGIVVVLLCMRFRQIFPKQLRPSV